jgi:DNA-binding beta-propeller fold protein YncE
VGILAVLAIGAGVALASPTEVLVTSRANNSILRYDLETGDFLGTFATGTGLSSPVDVTQGPDGDIYVGNFGSSRVTRFDWPTGEYLGNFAEHSNMEEIVTIIFHDDKLYAAANDTRRISVFNADTGSFVHDFGNPTMRYPHDFRFGPDGMIYVTTSVSSGNKVQVWDPETRTLVRDFAPITEMDYPMSLDFGPDGMLYISDYTTKKIERYDWATGEHLDTFLTTEAPLSHIEFGPDGKLYACTWTTDITQRSVERYDATTGEFIDVFIPGGGVLSEPRGLMFIPEPTSGLMVLCGAALTLLRRR